MVEAQIQRMRRGDGKFTIKTCCEITTCVATGTGGVVGALKYAASIGFEYNPPVGNETGMNTGQYKEESMTVIMIGLGMVVGCGGSLVLWCAVEAALRCCCKNPYQVSAP